MKVVCAYCGAELPQRGDPGDSTVSHGMCQACLEHFSAQWEGLGCNDYLDHFAWPVLVVDADVRVLALNRPAEVLVGRPKEQVVGCSAGRRSSASTRGSPGVAGAPCTAQPAPSGGRLPARWSPACRRTGCRPPWTMDGGPSICGSTRRCAPASWWSRSGRPDDQARPNASTAAACTPTTRGTGLQPSRDPRRRPRPSGRPTARPRRTGVPRSSRSSCRSPRKQDRGGHG